MRWWCVFLALGLGACSFSASGSSTSDAPAHDDAPLSNPQDSTVPLDGRSGVCGGKVWASDFSTDPTLQDLNHDSVNDFVTRDGNPLPGVLSNGVWTLSAGATALDTRPLQNFTTRVVAHVRMRSTSLPATHGAILWLNVNYNGTTFTPVFIDAALQPGSASGTPTQTAVLFTKSADGSEVPGATVADLDAGMHDYDLDIDPVGATADFAVDGIDLGSQTLTPDPLGGNTDRFATAQAYDGAAEFDEVRIEVCP